LLLSSTIFQFAALTKFPPFSASPFFPFSCNKTSCPYFYFPLFFNLTLEKIFSLERKEAQIRGREFESEIGENQSPELGGSCTQFGFRFGGIEATDITPDTVVRL